MKTLIFIVLKVLEFLGAVIALAVVSWGAHKIGSYCLKGTNPPLMAEILWGLAIIIVGVLIVFLFGSLLHQLIEEWFPQFIKWNRKLTDKIYNKYFK